MGRLSDLSRIESLRKEVEVLEKAAGRGQAVKGTRTAPALDTKPTKGEKPPAEKPSAEAGEGGS
jgi:hypothetical protein